MPAPPDAGGATPPTTPHPAAWNPVTGMAGWNPKVGPPGWAPQTGYSPPRVPPHDGTRGLSPFGMPARHSWEIPLLVIVVVLTSFAYLFSILFLLVGAINEYVLILLTAPVLLWLGRGMNYATMRLNAVKMSPTQFPEGYRMVQEAAARFGMTQVPDAYVLLGNGAINAFASGHGFRRFVVVYSDLFEIGGKARDPEGLAFIIGHEVGHIAAGHVSYWRQLGMFLVPFLPILGNSLIRSQEYTADNHGYCNRHTGAPGAMQTLAAGKYLNALVGFDEMADRAAREKGFMVWIVNAMSSHPVLTWRMWALRDRSRHGRLFLRPTPPTHHGPMLGATPGGGGHPTPPYGGYPTGGYGPSPIATGYPPLPATGSYGSPPMTTGYPSPPATSHPQGTATSDYQHDHTARGDQQPASGAYPQPPAAPGHPATGRYPLPPTSADRPGGPTTVFQRPTESP